MGLTSDAETIASSTGSKTDNETSKEVKGSLPLDAEKGAITTELAKYPWSAKGPAIFLVILFNMAPYWFSSSLAPLKTTLKTELGISNAQYGVITSSGNLVNSIWPFFSGVAIDYYGAEISSVWCAVMLVLGAVISGLGASFRNYGAVVSGEVIVGFGSITIETAQLKIFSHWANGSHLALILGLNNAMNRIVMLVAKVTAIPIADNAGWAWVLWVPAFVSGFVLAMTVIYLIVERRLPVEHRYKTGRQLAKESGVGGYRVEVVKAWHAVLALPAFFWILVLTQLCQNGTIQTFSSLQPDMYKVTRNVSLLSSGTFSALSQLPAIIGTPIAGHLIDRFGHRLHCIPLAGALFVLMFALIGWTQASPIALSLVIGVILSFNLLPVTAMIPIIAPSLGSIGTAQGTFQAFINAGHVVILTGAGAIQDLTPKGRHSYDNVLALMMAIKGLDVFMGIFYVLLDKYKLDSRLTRSERQQREYNAKVATGEIVPPECKLLQPSKGWTRAGVVGGVALVGLAWGLYLRYAQGSN
ncbi:MFS general substrate transporter [Meredithblackwellia eburnea MCA 4105]